MKRIRTFFVFVLLVFLFATAPSCSLFRPSADKKAERLQKQREKRDIKEYNKAKKEHYKNQSELTKELMKEAKRQQRKANRAHRRSLWDRLFNNKCRGGKK
jgi:cytochrome c biogenesis protein ResB